MSSVCLSARPFLLTSRELDGDVPADAAQLVHTATMTLRDLSLLALSPIYGDEARHELEFRVVRTLEEWNLDGDTTFKMLDTTDGVMSGSAVLNICDPKDWQPGDLDFYCALGRLTQTRAFSRSQGYTVVPQEHPLATTDLDDEYVLKNLMKSVTILEKQGKKINVIEASVSCAVAPLFAFHSTLVMNAVTAGGVVCYYPSTTMQGIGVLFNIIPTALDTHIPYRHRELSRRLSPLGGSW